MFLSSSSAPLKDGAEPMHDWNDESQLIRAKLRCALWDKADSFIDLVSSLNVPAA